MVEDNQVIVRVPLSGTTTFTIFTTGKESDFLGFDLFPQTLEESL